MKTEEKTPQDRLIMALLEDMDSTEDAKTEMRQLLREGFHPLFWFEGDETNIFLVRPEHWAALEEAAVGREQGVLDVIHDALSAVYEPLKRQ